MINRDGETMGDDGMSAALREYIDGGKRQRAKVMRTRDEIEAELLELGATPAQLEQAVPVFTEADVFGMVPGYIVGADPVEALEAWQSGLCRFPLELTGRQAPAFVFAYLRRHARNPGAEAPAPGAPPARGDKAIETGPAEAEAPARAPRARAR